MNVLSLFDGMSCGQIALKRIGVNIDNYFASEIKPVAIKLTNHHFPNTIHIGDVAKVSYSDGILKTEKGDFKIGNVDLLIGGSPCQNFSAVRTSAGLKVEGLEGEKSKLFYEYLRILKECDPKYFLLENVKMNKKSKEKLDSYLGVEGVLFNSSLVSIQTRSRYYWTNIKFNLPKDKNLNFQDFKDNDKYYCSQFKVNKTPSRERMWNNGQGRTNLKACTNITNSRKVGCLTRKQDRAPNSGLIEFEDFCRYLTRRELEIAQTVDVGYTDSISYNQAQDLLGDGWTVDVIAHILKGIK